MQQDNVTLNAVEVLEVKQQAVVRGPVLLQPEMLAWVSGGVAQSQDLPRATW